MKPLDINQLKPGEVIAVGNQLWSRCAMCEKLVRLNKPIMGSMHICLTEEEIEVKRKMSPQVRYFER